MSEVIIYAGIFMLGVFISAISQVLLKKSAVCEHGSVVGEYVNANVIIAYAMFSVAIFTSMYAYQVIPLSMGAVLESSSYFYVTLFGALFFGERITRRKVIGLIFILSGMIVYSMLG